MNDELKIIAGIVCLALLCCFLLWELRKYEDRRARDFETITRLKMELQSRIPPESALRDMVGSWHRTEEDIDRSVIVRFRTLAGMSDFHRWLKRQAADAGLRARAEALGQARNGPERKAGCK